jgi:2',3'-cyclic-nucleotide 2'-phosphodiesterase (5'-nucleotidase family)
LKYKILHTNDIHSRFENFAKIVTKINEIRDENTLVLDAGDFNDFMRLELQGTIGKAGGELLSLAGYDAITLGNNEGFEGIEAAESLANSGTVKFLSCNLYKYSDTDKDKEKLQILNGVKRSIIIEKGGVKFLIIGTSPYGTYNEFYSLLNMHSTDAVKEIKNEISNNIGKYDICILLSHCGMREDTEIANTIEGIDIIINGHSHILMEDPLRVNNSIVHMSGQYGEHLGILEFEYDREIKNYKGTNVNIHSLPMDEGIIRNLKINKEKAIAKMSESLYVIDKDLWHDVMEENPITNFLADSLKDLLSCDIGIINSGVINGGIRKGKVSRKKLLEICPSPLNPTYMEIEGRFIREALQKSIDVDFCTQDGKGAGFRGKYLGRLHISGGYIEQKGNKITKIIIGDNELDDDRVYSVATSDYLQRGSGYNTLAYNNNSKYSAQYLRDTLKDYLNKKEFINKALTDRWIIKEDI